MRKLCATLTFSLFFLLVLPFCAFSAEKSASAFNLSAPVLSGDLCFDLRASQLGCGPSYTFGTFGLDQMCELRGMWVVFSDENIPNKVGAGVAVNLPKLLAAAGVANIPAWFNPSVGVLVLAAFDGSVEFSLGVYATLVKFEF